MKRIPVWLILCLIVLVTNASLFAKGLPYTHDSQSHIARMANYYLALKEGQVPPRWAPNLNNRFGYPVFNFNYPLAYIVAAPLIAVNIPIQATYRVITLVSLLVATAGMYAMLRWWFKPWPVVVGTLVFVLSPYTANMLYVRGVIGESMTMALLPWVGYLLLRLTKQDYSHQNLAAFAVVAGMYLISHNIMVYLSLPLLFAMGWGLSRTTKEGLVRLVGGAGLAGLLASFFWVPALMEKGSTMLEKVPLSSQFYDHFPTLGQLFTSTHAWGFSYPGPVDGMSFALGVGWIMTMGLVTVMIMRSRVPREIWAVVGVGLFYVVMQLPVTKPVWMAVPMSNFVQFPWRLTLIAMFVAGSLAAWVTSLPIWPRWVIGMVLVILVWGASGRQGDTGRFDYPDEYWLTFSESTSILDENMPVWFDKFKAYELAQDWFGDSPVYLDGTGDYRQEAWTGSYREYTIGVKEPVTVYERGAYFPGWQVLVDGEQVDIEYDRDGNPGLIAYKLSPGSHTVISRFTQLTPARIMGNGLSFIGIGLVVGLSGYGWFSKYQKKS